MVLAHRCVISFGSEQRSEMALIAYRGCVAETEGSGMRVRRVSGVLKVFYTWFRCVIYTWFLYVCSKRRMKHNTGGREVNRLLE